MDIVIFFTIIAQVKPVIQVYNYINIIYGGTYMSESRYIGDYPVIGIRPTIDGRRGPLKVRESLEEQTMNMAKSAAELISSNLKYSKKKREIAYVTR